MKTTKSLKTGILTAILGMILLVGAAAAQTLTEIDRDGDGLDDYRDPYPDDDYRDDSDYYDRETEETDSTDTDGTGDTGSGDTEELCCFMSIWWLWVIAGALCVFADYRGLFVLYRKWILAIIGLCMIIYGFWLGGFL